MKIKLVTFAPHPNYGTCLQSYALNKVLMDMGHDVEFICNGRETPPQTLYYIKIIIKAFLPSKLVREIKEKRQIKRKNSEIEKPLYILSLPDNRFHYILSKFPFYKRIYKFFMCRTLQQKKVYSFTFDEGNYKMKRLYTRKQYDEVVADADLFITGSDQIWNPYCGGFNPMMFLEFAGDKKRVAYSSSIARPCFPKEIEERAKKDLQKFQHIAVREQSSVDMLNKLLGRNDVQLVVDPTYLLTRDEWTEFANRATIEINVPDKYIFCYFIGERYDAYRTMVEDVKSKTGIQDVITMNCTTNIINVGGGILYQDGGPYEFVYLLIHASYVCLDSFHGTLFSLFFEKDFVHILKSKDESHVSSQNTRIYDMFERYGILHKIYDGNNLDWLKTVDFKRIHQIADEERRNSINYLKKALED